MVSSGDIGLQLIKDKYAQFANLDPFPAIEPALLNSADIEDYVDKTGMIFPFDREYLKPASYGIKPKGEYIYWKSIDEIVECRLEDIKEKDSDGDAVFSLKRNSIAFVGLEPEFRFPNYIAARFNLKIKHIYQGLLLGTGPLVDPGFEGKLYIPIHNLTNNDYKIKIDKPIIWMEFTKLSSNSNWSHTYKAEGRNGKYKFFDKEKLKLKQRLKDYLNEAHPNAPIMSTIHGLKDEIDKGVNEAKNLIKNSEALHQETRKVNDNASQSIRQFNYAIWISIFAIVASLGMTVYQAISIQNQSINYLKNHDYRQQEEHAKYMDEQSYELHLKNHLYDLNKVIIEQEKEIKKLKKLNEKEAIK